MENRDATPLQHVRSGGGNQADGHRASANLGSTSGAGGRSAGGFGGGITSAGAGGSSSASTGGRGSIGFGEGGEAGGWVNHAVHTTLAVLADGTIEPCWGSGVDDHVVGEGALLLARGEERCILLSAKDGLAGLCDRVKTSGGRPDKAYGITNSGGEVIGRESVTGSADLDSDGLFSGRRLGLSRSHASKSQKGECGELLEVHLEGYCCGGGGGGSGGGYELNVKGLT
jgi:hypothetical protein